MNYYDAINSRIQAHEEMNDENLKKQWEDDINFAREELEEEARNKGSEDCYYWFFINRFLVAAIEAIIKEMNCKNDIDKIYSIRLYFENETIDYKTWGRSVRCRGGITVPEISEYFLASVDTNKFVDRILHYYLNGFFDKMYRNISVYSEVSTSADETPRYERKDDYYSRFEKRLSFECTLKDLISMYYMEKQRREYENYDARKLKK